MDHEIRKRVRLAQEIRTRLLTARKNRRLRLAEKIAELSHRAAALDRIRKRFTICAVRGYDRAGRMCLDAAESTLCDLSFQITQFERDRSFATTCVPPLRDILAELRQVEDEFGEIRHKAGEGSIGVVTDRIELEGVYLGPFEILLRLSGLEHADQSAACRVIALEPNPPSTNDSVTHPHVSDERLCAGDGGAAIQDALRAGRICDFFVLVRSVLTHYNPDSPYVRLEDWQGVKCSDCGEIVDRDDALWCHHCEEDFCSDCASYCRECEETICGLCLKECSFCRGLVCPACANACPDCGRDLCSTCIEKGNCPYCQEEEVDEDEPDECEDADGDEAETRPHPAATGAEVLADGVGQIAVPAGSR